MTGMLSGVTVKAEEWSGDVDHIVMTYMTLGTTPTDLQMVQDALNERSTRKFGVEVELNQFPHMTQCLVYYMAWNRREILI